MVPIIKWPIGFTRKNDFEGVQTEYGANKDVTVTKLRVRDYISIDMQVTIDKIRDLENILSDINISYKESIKESLENNGYLMGSEIISVTF